LSDTPSPNVTLDDTKPIDPTSILGQLTQRRQEIQDSLKLKLRVPHWTDPEIVVTFNPLQVGQSAKIVQRADKRRGISDIDRGFDVACDSLIAACESVVALIDGQKYSFGSDPQGPPTRFDADMAARFGLTDASARSVLRHVYVNDGDIVETYMALQDWSSQRGEQIDEEFQGE
jgi:hypothetical protein